MGFVELRLFYSSLISYREDKQTIPYCSLYGISLPRLISQKLPR